MKNSSLTEEEKVILEDIVKSMEQKAEKNEFILRKMAQSKKTTETFLNKTVEELEEKNKELSAIALESQRVNEQLVSTNEELEQFAFIISHDLQEPLRTILNFTNLLFRRKLDQLDEQSKTYLGFISQSSSRLSKLIKAILDYSRIGKVGHMTSIDCHELIDSVLSELHVPIKEKNAVIRIGEMPNIYGFRVEIHSLFQNLISNALKYSREEVRPEIQINCLHEETGWQFSVCDNGIGIKEDYLERIFIIFQRLNIFSDQEGSGIGLSRCKKIVELHSGKIWVESTPGQGSSFYFTIPHLNSFTDAKIQSPPIRG